jgi:polysaccharide biosynthesis transport protein
LESNAQTYRALYDNFLQRYMESVQQQSFPITEARVISSATRPLGKSSPKSMLLIGLATMVGLAFGVVAGAWRDFADRVFRTANQVEAALDADCIALIPMLDDDALKEEITDVGRALQLNDQRRKSNLPAPAQGREAAKAADLRMLPTGNPTITPVPGPYSAIIDAPFSAFTEAIRSIKVAVDLSPTVTGGRIIGFTSSVPNEGKSSIAASVARLAAHTGARTLLVDCDLRNPSLSRLLAPKAKSGLLEVARGQSPIESAIWVDPASNLRFLPAAMKARLAHSSEVLAAAQTRKLFDGLRSSYDYIILDFAPLAPIVDVRASTSLVDSYIYVVAWGKTRVDFVNHALHSARGVYERLLGVVLNKVDLRSLGRYDGHGSYYHHDSYQRYGYS